MGDTPVCTIDEFGIHLPDFATVHDYFLNKYRGIYGDDVYLGNDSQDGQFLGILSAAINDANMMAVQVYNAYSPATAQGTGLSSVVKINGIARKVPSLSSAPVLVVGQAGTVVSNGIVSGASDFQWTLPATVVIPFSGQVLVTAVCTTLGEVQAAVGEISTIVNPQLGWQTVRNVSDATPGLPVETDPKLRRRQALSTEIPGLGIAESLEGSLWALAGVKALRVYQNPDNIPDVNGIPGHTLAIVIDGGDVGEIASAIKTKKGGGVGTYGNEVQTIVDRFGIPHQIAFFRPTTVPITWVVTMDTYSGFTVDVQAQIARQISDWTNNLGIGRNVLLRRAYIPANLSGLAGSETFDLLDLQVARDGNPSTEHDVAIAFNERAGCTPSYIQFRFPDAP